MDPAELVYLYFVIFQCSIAIIVVLINNIVLPKYKKYKSIKKVNKELKNKQNF